MSQEGDEDDTLNEIVVVGARQRSEAAMSSGYVSLGGGNYIPSSINRGAIESGEPGRLNSEQINITVPNLDFSVQIPGSSLSIKVPTNDWAKLPADKQSIFYDMIKNFDRAPELNKALRFYESKNVSEIIFRFDDHYINWDGAVKPFEIQRGQTNEDVAVAVHKSDNNNGDRTMITANTPIVIWFNTDTLSALQNNYFSEVIVHELLHPFAPDIVMPVGPRDDHAYINQFDQIESQIITGSAPSTTSPIGGTIGISYIGNDQSEIYHGGNGDDVIAGMSGNDNLDGGLGTNILYGGRGQDILSSSGYNDLLSGGLEADTYYPANETNIVDSGGVDHIALNGYLGDFSFRRDGADLYVHHNNYFVEFVAVIAGHYSNSGRVEVFQFYDGEYSASYIDNNLYNPNGDTGPYGEEPHATPIILDLDSNGINIIDKYDSIVSFDINQDGINDSLSWINSSDGVLLFDRNYDGLLSNIDEISFINDFVGAASDAEGLLGFDTTKDGFLDLNDVSFNNFYVWQDINNDGISQSDEILSLEELAITSISLEVNDRSKLDSANPDSQILGEINLVQDGISKVGYDIAFSYSLTENNQNSLIESNYHSIEASKYIMYDYFIA